MNANSLVEPVQAAIAPKQGRAEARSVPFDEPAPRADSPIGALKRSGRLARFVRMACATLSEALCWKPKNVPATAARARVTALSTTVPTTPPAR